MVYELQGLEAPVFIITIDNILLGINVLTK